MNRNSGRGRSNKPSLKLKTKSGSKHERSQKENRRQGSERKTFTTKTKSGKSFKKDYSKSVKRTQKNDFNEEIRLNRFIANAGMCSRRDADKYIAAGLVAVNGKIITELGTKVKKSDDVRFDGKKLSAEKKVYLLLNKPKDFVTTTSDPYAERTVMDLVDNACPERIYPVGRLDKSTTGLLLFTNDGDMAERLLHPSRNIKKIYQVTLDKPLTKNDMLQIADGITLDDGFIAADKISYIDGNSKNEVGIEIHSGRNRIVRRIFEHFGYRIRKLDRVYFAGLTKKNVPRGKWRFLSQKEVQFLKMK